MGLRANMKASVSADPTFFNNFNFCIVYISWCAMNPFYPAGIWRFSVYFGGLIDWQLEKSGRASCQCEVWPC